MADPNIGNPFKIAKYGYDYPPRAGLISTWGYLDFIPADEIHIPDHVKRTQDLLIEQFEKKPKINGMVEGVVTQWQQIEDVGVELYTLRMLHTAGGYTLDILGEIIGLSRGGLDDDDYRAQLYFGIFLNISSGEPELLIAALKNVTGATIVHYEEIYPAAVALSAYLDTIPPANTLSQLQKLAPAGVRVSANYVTTDIRPFTWAGEGAIPTPAEGGYFAELGYAGDPGYKPGAFSELLT